MAEKAGNRCHVLWASEDRDKDQGPTDEADGVQAAGHSHSRLKRSGQGGRRPVMRPQGGGAGGAGETLPMSLTVRCGAGVVQRNRATDRGAQWGQYWLSEEDIYYIMFVY